MNLYENCKYTVGVAQASVKILTSIKPPVIEMESGNKIMLTADLLSQFARYAWNKAEVSQKISSKAADIIRDGLKAVPEESYDDAAKKMLKALVDATESKDFEVIIQQAAKKSLHAMMEEISMSPDPTKRVWTKLEIVGRTLVQGLTYAKCLNSPGAISILCCFLFGDVMELPTLLVAVLCKAVCLCYESVTNQQPSSLSVEAVGDENPTVEMLTALWQAVSGALNYKDAAPQGFFDKTFEAIRTIDSKAKSTPSVLKFFGILCRTVHRMYVWIADKVFNVKPFSRLLYQDNNVMRLWACEVQELTDPLKEHLVINNHSWFTRMVSCYLLSKYLVQEVSRAGVKDVPPTLISSHKRLTELYQKAINLGITTAFRPEPVSIWVAGPAGLGKSYNKDDLSAAILRSAGIQTTGNDLFTVGWTQKHWTGAEGKSMIYYDDFGTVDAPEFLGEGIGMYMQLISDARFSPPQASLEDKGKPVAPAFVYANGNEVVPRYHGVRHEMAFLRRRHIVVEVARSPEFIKRFGTEANLETEAVKASKWLERHATPEDRSPQCVYYFCDSVSGIRLAGPFSYEDYKRELVQRCVSRYNESYAKYESKQAAALDMAGFRTETPLIEVIEELDRRAKQIACIPPGESAFSWLTGKWSWFEGTVDGARKWLQELSGCANLTTQGPEETPDACRCNIRLPTSLLLDGDILYRNTGVDEEEYVYSCASADCYFKTAEFKRHLENWICTIPHKADIYRKLKSQIFGEPSCKKRVQFDVSQTHNLIPDIENACHPVVPKKEWSNLMVASCQALGVFACIFTSCVCLNKICEYMWPKSMYKVARNNGTHLTMVPAYRQQVSSQLLSSGDNHTARAARVGRGITRKNLIAQNLPSLDPSGVLSVESVDHFLSILDRAISFLVLNGIDRASQREVKDFPFRVFCLVGRWIVVPKHYLLKIARTEQVKLTFYDHARTSFIDTIIEEEKQYENSELALIRLSNSVPAFRDVRRHIMSENESSALTSRGYAFEKVLGQPTTQFQLSLRVAKDVKYNDGDVTYVLPVAFTYAWQAPGRCMTPIYSQISRNVIVGFHVAGSGVSIGGSGMPVGCAEPVVREGFDCITGLSTQAPSELEGICLKREPTLTIDANMKFIGCVAPRYSAQVADKTSIVPSMIHGYVTPTTRPAPLKPQDVDNAFSPLISGVEKHGHPPAPFEKDLLKQAQDALRQQYLTSCKPVRTEVGILSHEEAVLGLPGIDGYQAMELGTSEGYPWTATRPAGARDKRYLFDISEDRTSCTIDERVVAKMRFDESLRSKGIVPLTVFTDCLKDARISNKKFLVPGKTRIFSISPVHFTIEFRRYFLDILAAQKVNRLDMEHAVGIDVTSFEWTQLARRLLETGQNILCGDYSNFGPGLSSQVVYAVGQVWCDWYEHYESKSGIPSNEVRRRRLVRECMFEELRHSVHLCRELLYQVLCGSPSGAPCTVNINNDVNKLYVYMAWIKCFRPDPIMSSIVAFRKHVRLYVYGDDLIAGVSDEVIGRFNNIFLQKFLAEHGIEYTDETKSGDVRSHVSFPEASFLKGKWRKHETRNLVLTYAQDTRSVEDVANWCKKSLSDVEATRQAICDSLMLAFGQGRSYFEAHKQRLISAWSDKVEDTSGLLLYSFEEMDQMRYGCMDDVTITLTIDQLVEKERKWRADNALARKAACGMQSFVVGEE